ncbi:hypothetical protein B7P43_G15297, partial [Cryptotermes secundus]
KPNALLAKFVEDLGKLGKGLTKQDHIIVGGPGNSLDRNYHYSIENDHSYIAERTSNTNVGFVSLFKRHDKPWMNGRVRNMNPRLDGALMGHDMSHIGVIDTSSILREDYTMHGLHLSSRGKKRLTQLIAERVVGGRVSGISSIPVITNARASPFCIKFKSTKMPNIRRAIQKFPKYINKNYYVLPGSYSAPSLSK